MPEDRSLAQNVTTRSTRDPGIYPNPAVTPAAVHAQSDSVIALSDEAAPTALQPPGQARTLEAPRQGEGWIFLD